MSTPKILRIQERYYSPHHLLWQIARISYSEAEKTSNGRTINAVKAITFSALGAEAFVNAIGFRTNLNWVDFEAKPTFQKIELLCDHFKLSFSKENKPWTTINRLLQLRNDIVHGKPEHLKIRHELPEAAIEKTRFEIPSSKLEAQLTLGNAKNALEATEKMYELFRNSVPYEIVIEIFQDSWSGSVSAL
jgi:hypothetical protein